MVEDWGGYVELTKWFDVNLCSSSLCRVGHFVFFFALFVAVTCDRVAVLLGTIELASGGRMTLA